MSNDDLAGGGRFPIDGKRAWKWITKSAPEVAIILAALELILMIWSLAAQMGLAEDGAQETLRVLWVPAAVVFVLVLVITSLRKRLIGKVTTGFILIYCVCGLKQFLAPRLPPSLPAFYCFAGPMQPGCPGSPDYTGETLARAPVTAVTEVEPTDTPFPATSAGRVFIQFAGSLQRERMIELAQGLIKAGWDVRAADQGGERTAAAAGTNDVRFFYPEDKPAAEALAKAVIDHADWIGGEMTVRDLSKAGFKTRKGTLEIWTSR